MEQKDLQHIVCQFEIQGNVAEVKPLGNGLINTTYLVETEGDAPNYVLQHVNNAIFPDVGKHSLEIAKGFAHDVRAFGSYARHRPQGAALRAL